MDTCLEKQRLLEELFEACSTPESKYEKIIELGLKLPPLPKEEKTPLNLVAGCQSKTYITVKVQEDKTLYFTADSDALISKGLAALLIQIYQGEKPEALLLCPPTVLQKLKLLDLLSPLRSNGLKSIFYKMREIAAKASL